MVSKEVSGRAEGAAVLGRNRVEKGASEAAPRAKAAKEEASKVSGLFIPVQACEGFAARVYSTHIAAQSPDPFTPHVWTRDDVVKAFRAGAAWQRQRDRRGELKK